MTDEELSVFRYLAEKYVWWLEPELSMQNPDRVIVQVMNLGIYKDWVKLMRLFDDDRLRDALFNAKAGSFTPKRWNYWHIVLGTCDPLHVPPLPVRPLPPQVNHGM